LIPVAFEYRAPVSVDEALAVLSKYGEEARVIAGGHGLIPALKLRLAAPAVIVDLRRIPGLDGIEPLGEGVRIGALATHADAARSAVIAGRAPLLASVAAQVGDPQVRSWGTVVGSVCQADPAGDISAALLALDAAVEVASPRGPRSVPLGDFIRGVFQVALAPDEIAMAVTLPAAARGTCAYSKTRQNASGLAIAGVAAQLRMEEGRATEVAIAVTGIADRPFRATAFEDALRGRPVDPGGLAAAARGIAAGRAVLSDMHASAEYRAHLAEVHARRAVLAAAGGT
jgi:carbon-monoxide dehydrogenase medium subunit